MTWSADYVGHWGTPYESEEDSMAMLLWLAYHVFTENFDRQLPGCKGRHDEWMPAQGEPMNMSRRYASLVMTLMRNTARRENISDQAMEGAKRAVSVMTYKVQVMCFYAKLSVHSPRWMEKMRGRF